jgi:tetratricopeptide (TPR) repeat protein
MANEGDCRRRRNSPDEEVYEPDAEHDSHTNGDDSALCVRLGSDLARGHSVFLPRTRKCVGGEGAFDRAIDDFGVVIASDPGQAGAWYNRAVARYLKGDLDGALADYNRTLEINPRFTDAWVDRGAVFYRRGDWDAVINDNTQAIALNPRLAQDWNNRDVAR